MGLWAYVVRTLEVGALLEGMSCWGRDLWLEVSSGSSLRVLCFLVLQDVRKLPHGPTVTDRSYNYLCECLGGFSAIKLQARSKPFP